MLGKRGYPLECAAAQVCREVGARVITNMFVRDMDLADFNALDNRRLEVVADGLTLWRVPNCSGHDSLLCCDGSARRRAAHHDGAALEAARKRKEDTYPELTGVGGRARVKKKVERQIIKSIDQREIEKAQKKHDRSESRVSVVIIIIHKKLTTQYIFENADTS